jgi:hypothetical protein
MDTPNTMPAVAYRNLWSRLAEMRALDPGNDELLALTHAFAAIGRGAGALRATAPEPEDGPSATDGAELVPGFDWEHRDLPLSPREAEVAARVAEVTVVPE